MPYVKVTQESPALTSATTKVWQIIIEELGDIDQRARSRDAPQSQQLSSLQEVFRRMPPMHRKSWKALITDKKVILTLLVPAGKT